MSEENGAGRSGSAQDQPSDQPTDQGADMTGQFVAWLGLDLVETSGDRVSATWEAQPKLHQPYGIVHGGVHCSVVETLASIGGALWLGEKGQVVGVSNSTDFFKAVREGTLTSVAEPVHRGRSQQVWLVETHREDGKLVSRGQVRLQNLYPHESGAPRM